MSDPGMKKYLKHVPILCDCGQRAFMRSKSGPVCPGCAEKEKRMHQSHRRSGDARPVLRLGIEEHRVALGGWK